MNITLCTEDGTIVGRAWIPEGDPLGQNIFIECEGYEGPLPSVWIRRTPTGSEVLLTLGAYDEAVGDWRENHTIAQTKRRPATPDEVVDYLLEDS